jgi:hypothetical protein
LLLQLTATGTARWDILCKEVYNLVDWAKALETFIVGFGGVFITLVILMLGVSIFSKIVVSITNIKKKES